LKARADETAASKQRRQGNNRVPIV